LSIFNQKVVHDELGNNLKQAIAIILHTSYQSSKPMADKETSYDICNTIQPNYSSKERLEVVQKGRLDGLLFG
jgi:hypothetical protein